MYDLSKPFGNKNILEEETNKILLNETIMYLYHLHSEIELRELNQTKKPNLTEKKRILRNIQQKYGFSEEAYENTVINIKYIEEKFEAKYELVSDTETKNQKKRQKNWTRYLQTNRIPQYQNIKKYTDTKTVISQEEIVRVSNLIRNLQRDPYINSIILNQMKLRKNTRLYHGTTKLFENTEYVPSRISNWFSTDFEQSELHIIDEIINSNIDNKENDNYYPYIYEYKLKKDLNLIEIKDKSSFYKIIDKFKLNLLPFTSQDYIIAQLLCACNNLFNIGYIDGWYFPNDQEQVMLCHSENIGLKENKIQDKIQFTNIFVYKHETPLKLLDNFYDRNNYFKDYFKDYYKKIYFNNTSYDVPGQFRMLLLNEYEKLKNTQENKEEKHCDDYISCVRLDISKRESVENEILEKIDTNNNNFILGMITQVMRPYIYQCIHMLNEELQKFGILVISGGEAYNHNVIEKYRKFTPDIDTKLIIIDKSGPIEGYDELYIRNKIWKSYEMVIDYLEFKYTEEIYTKLISLSNTLIFQILGITFINPSDLKRNGGQIPHIFLRRYSIMEKGVSSRVFDIHLLCLDMIINSKYELQRETVLYKGEYRYFEEVKHNLPISPEKMREIKKAFNDIDIDDDNIKDYIKNLYKNTLTEVEAIQKYNTEWILDDNKPILTGLLDIAVMKQGELGDVFENPNYTSVSKCKIGSNDFDVLVASRDYLIHDIDIMTKLQLRKGKEHKDRERKQILENSDKCTNLPYFDFNNDNQYNLYNPIVRYTKNCVNNNLEQIIIKDFEYTNPNQSSSKILYLSFSPLINDLQKNGIPLLEPINIDKDLKILEVNICYDYNNREWIRNCYKDRFCNAFKYRFLRENITNPKLKNNIIYSLVIFLKNIYFNLVNLYETRKNINFVDDEIYISNKRDCYTTNYHETDPDNCHTQIESLSRMLYSTPIFVEDVSNDGDMVAESADNGKMTSVIDNLLFSSYILQFYDKYNDIIKKEFSDCKIDTSDTNLNGLTHIFMYMNQVVNNIIMLYIPLTEKEEYRNIIQYLYHIERILRFGIFKQDIKNVFYKYNFDV